MKKPEHRYGKTKRGCSESRRLGNVALEVTEGNFRRVLTPPKVGTTGAENLKGCDGRANKGADNGEGGKPRGEHPEGKKMGRSLGKGERG